MKRVMMITMIAVALSVSPIAFAYAGCGGGYGFNGKAGYGCSGFQGGNGWCSSMMSSATSYVQSAAYRCCAGVVDFFQGGTTPSAGPGPSRAQAY
jgi:hypothetical protein